MNIETSGKGYFADVSVKAAITGAMGTDVGDKIKKQSGVNHVYQIYILASDKKANLTLSQQPEEVEYPVMKDKVNDECDPSEWHHLMTVNSNDGQLKW